MISVLIVDDQPLQRLGFRMLFESTSDTTVAGEAGDGAEAIRQIKQAKPDVVLMDIRMPGLDGIEATRRITASTPDSHVLIMTTFDLDEYVYNALRAGASGFMLKDALPEELLSGIRAVANGGAIVAPTVTKRLLEAFTPRGPRPADPDGERKLSALTTREREILTLIGLGLNNTEITKRLYLAESTVKTHVSRILTKIGARDRVQAVIFAYDHDLAEPK